ncbi:MAG TPA: flagellar filament capping protein FliD, partial [Burkholderiaceae bacterium]|nr:flagellar filament capping protein FliD [Burkholderiaceae bacterium]
SGLATMLQSAINGTSEFATLGSAVAATIDGNGHLNVASSRYGSASNITISSSSGTAVATILGDTPAAKVGVDVAGTIGGMDASGSGKYLTGGTGSSASGLKLLVAGGSIGARGAIDFSRGYADKLNDLLDTFLGSSGMISNRTKGINSSIKEISNSRDALNTRLAATEKRYRAQFLALDTVISSMKKTSDFLTQQLANLPKIE